MAWSFTGVNTGNKYEAGQTYKMGGDSYVAQFDGSFVNQQTGRSFEGASKPDYDQEVSWSYDGDSYSSGYAFAPSDQQYVNHTIAEVRDRQKAAASTSGYGGVTASAAKAAVPARAGLVQPAARPSSRAGSASSFADSMRGTSEAHWSQPGRGLWDEYKNGPSAIPNSLFYQQAGPGDVKGRPLPMGGFNWEMNPNWPNAEKIEEEFGDAEFLSPGFFMNWGAAAAAVAWNASRLGAAADSAFPDVMAVVRSNPIWSSTLDGVDSFAGAPARQRPSIPAPHFPVSPRYEDVLQQYKQAGIAANGPL